jgi:hypothetical protein
LGACFLPAPPEKSIAPRPVANNGNGPAAGSVDLVLDLNRSWSALNPPRENSQNRTLALSCTATTTIRAMVQPEPKSLRALRFRASQSVPDYAIVSRSLRMLGIPRRYSHFVFGVIQSGLTSAIAAAIASYPIKAQGTFLHWLRSWLLAWLIMTPIVLFAAPAIRGLTNLLTREETR